MKTVSAKSTYGS